MNIGQGRPEPQRLWFESPMEVILSAPSFDVTPTVIRFTEQVEPPPLIKDRLTSHTPSPSPSAQSEPEPGETETITHPVETDPIIEPAPRDKPLPPKKTPSAATISPYNQPFLDMLGEEILLTLDADKLNILGHTCRAIFCGRVSQVTDGYITLDPVIIKMPHSPFQEFPTSLSFPIARIAQFVPFDSSIRFPIP